MITGNSILKIIVVHENLTAGIAAVTVLKRMVAQLEAELEITSGDWQIDSNVWKFEMLRDPELCVQAATEAAEADMIIISLGSDGLPARIKDWLESVLPMKDGKPAALVTLLNRRHDAGSEPPRSGAYLRRLAKQYGLDFFCNTDDPSENIASGIESIASRCDGNLPSWRKVELHPAGMGRQQTQFGEYAN